MATNDFSQNNLQISQDQQHKDKIEASKLLYDLSKHLTTLSAGSLLLIATLVEKIFHYPEWRFMMPIAFGSLALSIGSSLLCMAAAAIEVHQSHDTNNAVSILGAISFLVTLLFFFFGMMAIAVFAVKNFLL